MTTTPQTEAQRPADDLTFTGRYGYETEDQAQARRLKRNVAASDELRRLDAALDAELANRDALDKMLTQCIAERDQLRAQLSKAVAEEREACAKVCERINLEYEGEDVQATWCADAIRARGGQG